MTATRECDYRDSAELELDAAAECTTGSPKQMMLIARAQVWATLAVSLAIDEQTRAQST